jgi:predicted 3-demethylubiquinone-9 3-methyltransferase (glyoxalase superfamily)
MNKITPNLWFATAEGKLSEVVEYYQSIFGKEWSSGPIFPLGETPSGQSELCQAQLFGQRYSLIATAQLHHSFNDAISLVLTCEDQNEIDRYWNYFTQEGQESQCGWCQDRFGLRWQIIPQNLSQLLQTPNGFSIMMTQKKIVIQDYLK